MTEGANPPLPDKRPARWPRRLAWTAGAIAVLVVAAWLAVPPIVRSQLESRLEPTSDGLVDTLATYAS